MRLSNGGVVRSRRKTHDYRTSDRTPEEEAESAGLDDRHCCGACTAGRWRVLLRRAICEMWAQGSPDATEVAMPVAGPDSGLRRSFTPSVTPRLRSSCRPLRPKSSSSGYRSSLESCRSNSEFEWRISTTWVMNVSAILRFSRCIWAHAGEGEFETDVRLSGREETTRNSNL